MAISGYSLSTITHFVGCVSVYIVCFQIEFRTELSMTATGKVLKSELRS